MDDPVIAARFRPVRPLDDGAPGEELEAVDGDRPVRLLLVPLLRAPTGDELAAFLGSADPLGPAVVAAGVDGGRFWVAWEWLPVPTLFGMFRELGTQLPARVARDLFVPFGQALVAAHRRGVVHGHLSPHRLLVDGDRILALDLGLERLVEAGVVAARPRSPLFHPSRTVAPALHDAITFCRIAAFLTRSAGVERDLPKVRGFEWDLRLSELRDPSPAADLAPDALIARYERLMAERLDPPVPEPPPAPPPPSAPPRVTGEPGPSDARVARMLVDAGLPEVALWPEDAQVAERRIMDGAWWLPERSFPAETAFFGDESSPVRATIAGGVLTLWYPHEAWLTSHERGTTTTAYTSIRCVEVTDPAALLERLAAAPVREPREHVCRFCDGTFGGMDFHVDLGACHGCAERHLGLVH